MTATEGEEDEELDEEDAVGALVSTTFDEVSGTATARDSCALVLHLHRHPTCWKLSRLERRADMMLQGLRKDVRVPANPVEQSELVDFRPRHSDNRPNTPGL